MIYEVHCTLTRNLEGWFSCVRRESIGIDEKSAFEIPTEE